VLLGVLRRWKLLALVLVAVAVVGVLGALSARHLRPGRVLGCIYHALALGRDAGHRRYLWSTYHGLRAVRDCRVAWYGQPAGDRRTAHTAFDGWAQRGEAGHPTELETYR